MDIDQIIDEVEFRTAVTDFGQVLHGFISIDGKDYTAVRKMDKGVGGLGAASREVVKAIIAHAMKQEAA